MASSFLNFVRNVERIGQKKRGRRPVFSAHQFYPSAIEADLQKATREEFARALEQNIQLALMGFVDDLDDLAKTKAELPPEFVKKVSSLADAVGVKTGWNFSEYSKMLVGQPYFPPEAEKSIFDAWKANFQQLCISAETDAKAKISRLATDARMKGWSKSQLESAIRRELPMETKHRAELIARTEMGKLNSAANLSTYKKLGIRYYMWMTTLDGRERDSHALMNGLICSVENPDVYYEETPEGLVEHPRSSEMYHGTPGEDFQCRCSMVAWEPEIDGKYQVRQAEQPETPQQGANEATSAQLEKMEQTIAQQEKQLQALKMEQESLLSRQRLIQAAEKRHERTPQQIADIQNRWEERLRRRRIAEIAQKRHEKRTISQENAIRKELERRTAIRTEAHKLLQEANGLHGLSGKDELEKALQKGGKSAYSEMEAQSAKLEESLKKLKACTYLEDPIQVARDFDYDTAILVNDSVKKKLDGMPRSLSSRKHDLEFEIKWVEDHKKYSSWKVAQDAYKKALREVEQKILWESDIQRVDEIKDFLAKHPKSGIIKKLAEDMDAAIAKGDAAARTELQQLLKKAETRKAEIEAKELRERLKKIKSGTAGGVPFGNVTLPELKATMGANLPKTLEHLDDAIAKYEKSRKYGSDTKKFAKEIEANMKMLFQQHDLGMHIDDDILEKVFTSHFKNTFETGSSGGYCGPCLNADGSIKQSHYRLGAAHNLFGLGSTDKANQLKIGQYEKYGNLLDHDKLREFKSHNPATQYGNVTVRFKKDKVVCTWTAGDSLGETYQPSLVTDPKAVSYDDMSERKLPKLGTDTSNMANFRDNNIRSYLELQFHGDVTIDCVESLTYPYDLMDKARAKHLETAKKWQSIGAEVYYIKNGMLKKL